ncbi:ABC transporter permease [Alkalibacter rhizosphaerae]|uniref:ABC transporter permease n=1 Tax=Alkalibacter rhizosphaerae TaxID=2815577 RepID=A0A974XKN9_9FIRM|nr:ABC transporter permease [Alkalibacter rhizosphaerae]QSX07726.1 ABC transporter permease [Alkalibacter rhizosphaerae]
MFPFKIASRFLRYSLGQTILIIVGIAIGVSVQVFIGLLIQGLQKDLVDTTIGNSSQITISPVRGEDAIQDWETIYSDIDADQPDVNALSASADGPAFLIGEDQGDSVLIRGWEFDRAEGIYGVEEKITKGSLPSEGEVLMGVTLQEELGLSLGDEIDLVTPEGTTETFVLSGFFDFKVSNINRSWLLTDLKTAQDLFGLDGAVTSMEMQVEDVFAADLVAESIGEGLDPSLVEITNWKEQNEELLSGLNGQSISSIMIQVFVMVSVILGISSVLAISVLQKSKEIGILKAMGIKDGSASAIFLLQGLILGIFGAILGVALGLGLSVAFTKFAVNTDGSPIIALYLNYEFIALSGGIAVVACLLASLIPARKSLKLNPIEVIRNG